MKNNRCLRAVLTNLTNQKSPSLEKKVNKCRWLVFLKHHNRNQNRLEILQQSLTKNKKLSNHGLAKPNKSYYREQKKLKRRIVQQFFRKHKVQLYKRMINQKPSNSVQAIQINNFRQLLSQITCSNGSTNRLIIKVEVRTCLLRTRMKVKRNKLCKK